MLDDRTLLDHHRMLVDELRLEPFGRALRATCADRVVVEIGVGLGPLSLMALRAGARRVYGIEADPRTLAFSTELMQAHGFGPDRFVPLCGRSDEIVLPELADVVVGELIDSIGIGENAAHYLGDAGRRWLRPGGLVIPGHLSVDVWLAECAVYAQERAFWTHGLRARHGLDYGPMIERLTAPRRTLTVTREECLSDPARWVDVDFGRGQPVHEHATLEFEIRRDGVVQGLAASFLLRLVDDIVIDTTPGRPATCWEQGFLPFPRPLPVRAGQRFRLELAAPPTDEPWTPVSAELERLEPSPVGETSN